MSGVLAHVLLSALVFGLLTISCFGWGQLALRSLARPSGHCFHSPCLAEAVILGLVVLGTFSIFINFVAPMSGRISWPLIVAGVLYGVHGMTRLETGELIAARRDALILGLLLIFYCYWSLGSGWSYDSGLYHLQSLEWIRQEPVALGLGNLHTRLAYNSFWLSVVSAVNLPGLGNLGIHSADYLVTALAILILGRPLLDPAGFSVNPLSSTFAVLALLGMSVTLVLNSSPVSFDQVAALFFILSVHHFLRVCESAGSPGALAWNTVLLLIFCTVAVLIRVTAIPVLLLGAGGVYLCKQSKVDMRALAPVSIACILLTTLWLLRNILLSGCLVFPIALTCTDWLPWSVGAEMAGKESAIIRAWARYGSLDYLDKMAGVETWLAHWTAQAQLGGWFRNALTLPASIVVSCALLWSALGVGKWNPASPSVHQAFRGALVFSFFTVTLQLLTWFMSVPDPRFAWGGLFALLALLGTVLAWPAVRRFPDYSGRGISWARAIAVVLLLYSAGLNLHNRHGGDLSRDKDRLLVTHKAVAIPGATINVPVATNQCWQVEIPCAPRVSDSLIVERAGIYALFRNEIIED